MTLALALVLLSGSLAFAQGTAADYERSRGLRTKFQDLALDVPGPANWIAGTPTFWYRKTVKGGAQFILVDAEKHEKRPAFDHEKLAAALGPNYKADTLPFQEFAFADEGAAITFAADGSTWRCTLADYTCKK